MMKFPTIDLTPRIGTEIKAERETLWNGSAAAQFRDILEQRGVIVLREFNLDDRQQVAFAKTLGELDQMGREGIFKIALNREQNRRAGEYLAPEYLKGTFFWHIDGTTGDRPNRATLLSAHSLPPAGGQTEFANTYAAYDDLPESEKKYLDTLKVVHSLKALQRVVNPTTCAEQQAYQRFPEKTHPLVWRHQSGRKSLVLGMTASHVEGMSLPEGRALLGRLIEWATQPKFVYRHEWRLGDLVVWDNTGTMHRVVPYALDSGRMMHRTTLVGEERLA
jgi:alpha-ketoglutarate-dependent taurine dioxygenase